MYEVRRPGGTGCTVSVRNSVIGVVGVVGREGVPSLLNQRPTFELLPSVVTPRFGGGRGALAGVRKFGALGASNEGREGARSD